MSNPFATGSGSASANITDFNGALLYIVPKEKTTVKTADFGEKDVVIADVHVLDGDDKGAVETDVFIFQGRLIAALKRHVAKRPYVGRLGKGSEKVKGNFPWEFTEPNAKEEKLALDYHEKLVAEQEAENPFGTGGE